MPNFTDTQITNWAITYEREIAARFDFVADRISLPIISGSNEYELPNYVTNIRSVLYLGKELHPKGFRASVLTGDTPFQTSGSIPYEYVFSGKGLRVLKFYPSPNQDIAEYTDDLWTPAADEAAVIVEFCRTPDLTDTSLQLPDWFKRYIIKDHICMKSFSAEGPGQDLRAATYYSSRIDTHESYLMTIKENMNQAIQRVLYENKQVGRRKPGRPVLPPNFGYPSNY